MSQIKTNLNWDKLGKQFRGKYDFSLQNYELMLCPSLCLMTPGHANRLFNGKQKAKLLHTLDFPCAICNL